MQCGISEVEMPDGQWPLWACGPYGPRAIFFLNFGYRLSLFYFILFIIILFLQNNDS